MQATLHRTRFVAALNDIFVGYLTKPDRPLKATKSPQWKFGAHGTGVNFDYRGEASRRSDNANNLFPVWAMYIFHKVRKMIFFTTELNCF